MTAGGGGASLPPGRVADLLGAVVDVGGDLDLPRVLERIVAAACGLVDARYGALGVLAEPGRSTAGRRLGEFVTFGLSPEQRERLGEPPSGHGLLGLLIDNPRPVRVSRVRDHPRSVGFPAGHPPMTTFLGVPVRSGQRIFGNLYLTDKAGGEEFTEEDEQVVTALAAAAGVAVANARLYAESERRRRWVQASSEITAAILGRVDRGAALALVARRAREVAGAELAAVVVEDDDGRLVVEAADGDPGAAGRVLDRGGAAAEVLEAGEARTVPAAAVAPWLAERAGQAVLAPVAGPQGRDTLLVVASRGAVPADVEPVRMFAAQAVIALDRLQAERDRAELAVLEDRDRIARDLHDLVIQRLFATGLQLQGAVRFSERPEARERIEAAVDDLDATIRDIRASIFALHRREGDQDLRGALADLVAESSRGLGFTPALTLEGPLEHAVPAQVRDHLLAVLREALANAARHSRATRAAVLVTVGGGLLAVEVRDNGVGLSPDRRESGLANLRQRAKEFGGDLSLGPAAGGGTVLAWRIPLR